MAAYFVARVKVKNPELLAEYSQKAAPIITKFGGKLLFKGNADNIFLGDSDYPNVAVFEFTNRKAIDDFYHSDEYQAVIPLREKGADMTLSAHDTQ